MLGDSRQRRGGVRSFEGLPVGRAPMFAAAMLFVVAAAIIAGLFIGMRFGR